MAGSTTGYGEWPTWLDTATMTPACRGQDTDLFFPTATTDPDSRTLQIAQAKAFCSRCPLLDPCREWALRQPLARLVGIWGGTTATERKRLFREKRFESAEPYRAL